MTCILPKPKLILPDNARVAVYRVCTISEKKKQVKCLDFPPEHKKHLDLDLRNCHDVYRVAMTKENIVFIYLFFQSNIFLSLCVTY